MQAGQQKKNPQEISFGLFLSINADAIFGCLYSAFLKGVRNDKDVVHRNVTIKRNRLKWILAAMLAEEKRLARISCAVIIP